MQCRRRRSSDAESPVDGQTSVVRTGCATSIWSRTPADPLGDRRWEAFDADEVDTDVRAEQAAATSWSGADDEARARRAGPAPCGRPPRSTPAPRGRRGAKRRDDLVERRLTVDQRPDVSGGPVQGYRRPARRVEEGQLVAQLLAADGRGLDIPLASDIAHLSLPLSMLTPTEVTLECDVVSTLPRTAGRGRALRILLSRSTVRERSDANTGSKGACHACPTHKSVSGSLTRRATLKGAGLAVGTLWVAPLVQVITMDSAAAASAPPSRVQTGGGTTEASGPMSGGTLPRDTAHQGPSAWLPAGVAAVAVGAGAVVAARRMPKQDPAESAE